MTAKVTWQAEDIIRAVHGECLHDQTWRAHGVAIDSRKAQPADLYVALKGPNHDGHEFAGGAFAQGAVGAIVSRQPTQVPAQVPLIFVDDTFHALEQLGRAGRDRSQASIVAVTGSVGKTSTKEMLRLMLAATGATYANEGSLNNHWGVPLSLARLPVEARYGVFEVGMNHAGELGPLSRQVRPDVALITTVEAVHLEFFASIDAIADAKAEIFLGMKPDGVAVLNHDNSQFTRVSAVAKAQGIRKILGFGRGKEADARMIDLSATPEGSSITVEIMGKKITYRLSAHGNHLAMNSLGALLASVMAGGDLEACAVALDHFEQPKGRGGRQAVTIDGGSLTLIDESYNASPVAVQAAIRVLGQAVPGAGGRRVLALGDMRELGISAAALHADLGRHVIDARIDQVFCCGTMMKHLYDALPPGMRGAYSADSAELAPMVAKSLHPGDVVTVKGSLSTNMKLVVEAIKALDHDAKSQKMAG